MYRFHLFIVSWMLLFWLWHKKCLPLPLISIKTTMKDDKCVQHVNVKEKNFMTEEQREAYLNRRRSNYQSRRNHKQINIWMLLLKKNKYKYYFYLSDDIWTSQILTISICCSEDQRTQWRLSYHNKLCSSNEEQMSNYLTCPSRSLSEKEYVLIIWLHQQWTRFLIQTTVNIVGAFNI